MVQGKQPDFKFSIITVCRNSEDSIAETIASVAAQTHKNTEHIIIEGASTDGTLAMIEKYRDRISKLVSEPDKGIYDAMNKGIALATGDYVFFLNSGDRFTSEYVLQRINEIISSGKDGIDVLHGKVWVFDRVNLWGFISDVNYVSDRVLFLEAVPHQATFIRLAALKERNYNTAYRISADFEWFVYAYVTKKYRFKYAEVVVSSYDPHGVSSDANALTRRTGERVEILKQYYSTFRLMQLLLFNYLKAFRYPKERRRYVIGILNKIGRELLHI